MYFPNCKNGDTCPFVHPTEPVNSLIFLLNNHLNVMVIVIKVQVFPEMPIWELMP